MVKLYNREKSWNFESFGVELFVFEVRLYKLVLILNLLFDFTKEDVITLQKCDYVFFFCDF